MKKLILIMLLFFSIECFSQTQLPVTDTTKWTYFRDYNYNPNIDTIAKKFDSIFSAFKFYVDSIKIQQALIIDSLRFANTNYYIDSVIKVEYIEFDTIRFKDGTKQTTAYTE